MILHTLSGTIYNLYIKNNPRLGVERGEAEDLTAIKRADSDPPDMLMPGGWGGQGGQGGQADRPGPWLGGGEAQQWCEQ